MEGKEHGRASPKRSLGGVGALRRTWWANGGTKDPKKGGGGP